MPRWLWWGLGWERDVLGGEGEGLQLGGLWEPSLQRVVVGVPAVTLKGLLGGVGAAGVTVHELAGFICAFHALEGAVDEGGKPGVWLARESANRNGSAAALGLERQKAWKTVT